MYFQPQRGFTPPPQMNASGPPGMHPQQRPAGAPGASFQNVGNMRGGTQLPNTPSGKRPQDSRVSHATGPPKG